MEVQNRKITEEAFEAERQTVLTQWPTGAEVDPQEALRYQEAIAPAKRFAPAMAKAKKERRTLIQPRAGVPVIAEHIKLMQYLQENNPTICIVTGGKGAAEPFPEGQGMKDYLVKAGIPEDRIIVEDRALNTVQNIQYSMALMSSPNAPTAIVTNNFHVTRGLALARGQGLTDVYAIAAPSDPLFLPNNMLREFFGLTKDFLLGNL